MSNLSMFLNYISVVLNTCLDWAIGLLLVIIFSAIAVTELMKAFNPNIETTEQAMRHIAIKVKEFDEKPSEDEDGENPIFDKNSPFLVFLLFPMVGMCVLIAFIVPLFPIYTVGWLDIVIKYYVSVLPYFAIVVSLYYLGLMSSRAVMWGVRKAFELAEATTHMIKKEETEKQ